MVNRTDERAFVDLNVIYSNVDGLCSKRLEITDLLREKRPMVLCMVETKVPEDVNLELFGWEEYSIWRRDRVGKTGGGVCVLVHKSLRVKKLETGMNLAEVLAVEVSTKENERLTVVATYVAPYTQAWSREEHEQMRNETLKSLEKLVRENDRILICGDFNCGEVDWEEMDPRSEEGSWGSRVLNQMTESALFQHITEPTRERGEDTPSRLDLMFTRRKEEIDNIVLESPLGKSDHVVITGTVWLRYGLGDDTKRSGMRRYNFKRMDKDKMRKMFSDRKWFENSSKAGTEAMLEEIMKVYEEVVQETVPVMKIRERDEKAWFNERCRRAKEERDKRWKQMRREKNSRTIQNYRRARNIYTDVRREEEAKYEDNIVEKFESDPKIFFKYLSSKTKIKNAVQRLKVEGKLVEEEEEMAQILNEKFREVFVEDRDCLEDYEEQNVILEHKLEEINFDREEVVRRLRLLDVNKALGPDQMSGWVLKNFAEELSWPIYRVFVESLKEGCVPSKWKEAQIVAIHKGGCKEVPLNYRPVSLLCILIKVLEGIIRDRWMAFLEEKEALTTRQFGFRSGRSCITNLLSFYSRVIDIVDRKGGWADCVYLDLKKAFDKVSHNRLIYKLERYGGVSGKLLTWMRSYLRGRKMKTIVRGVGSQWADVTSGVPQGSVLAPLMFLIYVNDLPDGLVSYINMFADDAKLMRQVRTPEDEQDLQRDLDLLYDWSVKWKMEFNASKCHVMKMGRSIHRPNTSYKMGSVEIDCVEREKDLGVIIQNDLSPEGHINKIVGEGLAIVSNIRATFVHLTEHLVKKIIEIILRPKLEYAQVVWAPHLKKHLRKLERVQRAATKLVPDLRDLEYQERLKVLNLPTLEERRKRGDMIQMYKCVMGMDRIDRDDFVVRDMTSVTRGGHELKLRLPGHTTDVGKYSFPARSIHAWNSLPGETARAENIHRFKKLYDEGTKTCGSPRV